MLLENLHFENQLRHPVYPPLLPAAIAWPSLAAAHSCGHLPSAKPGDWIGYKVPAGPSDHPRTGPSLDALRQLDRLALQLPQGRLLQTRLTKPKNVKYESCCHKTTEMSEAIASWADSVAFERREENVSCPCFEYRGYIQI